MTLNPADLGLTQLTKATRNVQARVDPLGWSGATAAVAARAAGHPAALLGATAKLAGSSAHATVHTARMLAGLPAEPAVAPEASDNRFTDPAWTQNPFFAALQQAYLIGCQYLDDVLAAGRGDDITDRKAAMALHLIADGLAPTNFLATNPSALVRAFQTGGRSVAAGMRYTLNDIRQRRGFPSQVDASGFKLGDNLAATAGSVIYRNELIELIQYKPQTDQVREVPVLFSPPWINKYYIMDLAPGRSLVEWAIRQGRTGFMLSYRNPDESMRDLTMDDYLTEGVLAALDVVTAITKADRVDVVSVCLGGAMATMAAAYLKAGGDDRIGALTLINTMLDYSEPGDLCTMVDPATLERLAIRMNETGFLAAEDMSAAFDILRPRDLIFRYVVSHWLLGEPTSAFDILAWNADSTRMPAAMHSAYLHSLYGRNELATGDFELAGRRLDLGAVTNDTYVVGAVNDHIVPWPASYAATRLLGGPVRYVLSNGGHIAGIVNPPSPKAWLEASEHRTGYPERPDQWRAACTRQSTSWWQDWASWSDSLAGDQIKPPTVGNSRYRRLTDAPGDYVHG
jgi:polyhydroxyalkanoate synthase subunit PhaC